METLEGTFKSLIYEGNDGYMVASYRSDLREVVAVGHNLPTLKKTIACFNGEWKTVKGRKSFYVQSFSIQPPSNKEGVVEYFKALKCGVGKTLASRAYDEYGLGIFDIIKTSPESLKKIRGFTKKIIDKILEKYEFAERLNLYMKEFGNYFSTKILSDLAKKFSFYVIKNDIFKACMLNGISFSKVDEIAILRGEDLTTYSRFIAACNQTVSTFKSRGNICYPVKDFIGLLLDLLNKKKKTYEVKGINEQLTKALDDGHYVIDNEYIYDKRTYNQEVMIAGGIMNLSSYALKFDNEAVKDKIKEVEEGSNINLAERQKEAIVTALTKGVSIVSGGPGTGKTTVINTIIHVFQSLWKDENMKYSPSISLLAPTGRAAKNMALKSNMPASTIHSKIGLYGDETIADILIDDELIIVDEMSMVDQYTMWSLIQNIQCGSIVVFVGDPDQLPSVGCGNILSDMIKSEKIPVTILNEIFRQGSGSSVITNALAINSGKCKDMVLANDFVFKPAGSEREIFGLTCGYYISLVKREGFDNTVLLCPFRTKGHICCNTFNAYLQNKLNPYNGLDEVMKSHGIEFRKKDRVIQIKNKEDRKNGDIGTIIDISYMTAEEIAGTNGKSADDYEAAVCAIIEFDGIQYAYTKNDMENVDLAYCMTVHKSQGSEYKNVIMVMSMEHKILLSRRLFYTAVTRAAKNVLLVGEKTAIAYAIHNHKDDTRYSQLEKRLEEIEN